MDRDPQERHRLAFGRRSFEVAHPGRVLFPEDGITRQELIDHHLAVAPRMLPQLRGRPLSLQRWPEGIAGPSFFQKAASPNFPAWIPRVRVAKEDGELEQVLADHAAVLAYLVNLGTITFHAWLSRVEELHRPDQLVLDLDPPDAGAFELARRHARGLGALLRELGLAPFLKTTGSRGLHLVVPLDRSAGFDEVRAFARALARGYAEAHPDEVTDEIRKEKRRGRLFLDTGRNAYAQTAVPAYAVRALPGAPVATPLAWEELEDPALDARSFTIRNLAERLAAPDPWNAMGRSARALRPAAERLASQGVPVR